MPSRTLSAFWFCAIPVWRGRFRSRTIESLVIEARELAAQGVQELCLIAQDTTRYGEDLDLGRAGGLFTRAQGRRLWRRGRGCTPSRRGAPALGGGAPGAGAPPLTGGVGLPVTGSPVNPASRQPPAEPVLSGISVIDELPTLVRGQKLPVCSVAGLRHLELAGQIAAQASASRPGSASRTVGSVKAL